MNSASIKIVKTYTRTAIKAFVFAFFFLVQVRVHAQTQDAITIAVDAEKAKVRAQKNKLKKQAAEQAKKAKPVDPALIDEPVDMTENQSEENIFQAIKKSVESPLITQDIVILNTEAGFLPETINVKKGGSYTLHVVNLNPKEKNVSFLMDAFTQSHNTIYGIKKSFLIRPQVEGIFSYQCPETGVQGKVVVVNPKTKRVPASVESE